jgi:acetolactate synthase small subunit
MLELELADLKIQQHQEKSVQEKTQLQLYAEQISHLTVTEKSLRFQLTTDQEKFQQFQVLICFFVFWPLIAVYFVVLIYSKYCCFFYMVKYKSKF